MKNITGLVVLCLAVPAGLGVAQEKRRRKPMGEPGSADTWNKFAYARVKTCC